MAWQASQSLRRHHVGTENCESVLGRTHGTKIEKMATRRKRIAKSPKSICLLLPFLGCCCWIDRTGLTTCGGLARKAAQKAFPFGSERGALFFLLPALIASLPR